jgi:hypothetical protein
MPTLEDLRNEKGRVKTPMERYVELVLSSARRGGKQYDIIDINESLIEKLLKDLKETFIDVPINIIEYNNPIMSKPQKIIRIDWS